MSLIWYDMYFYQRRPVAFIDDGDFEGLLRGYLCCTHFEFGSPVSNHDQAMSMKSNL